MDCGSWGATCRAALRAPRRARCRYASHKTSFVDGPIGARQPLLLLARCGSDGATEPLASPGCLRRPMFNVCRHRHPVMLTRLPDGDRRRREGGISESANGNRDQVRRGAVGVEDGRTAFGTELERALLVALVGHSDVLMRTAGHAYLVSVKARLNPERTPSTTLAGKAVADRNAPWFAPDRQLQLAAAASSFSCRHAHTVDSARGVIAAVALIETRVRFRSSARSCCAVRAMSSRR